MIEEIIIIILGISTLIQVCDMCGFLPSKLKKFFILNRSGEMMEVLKEFGIDSGMYRRKNATIGIPRDYNKVTVEKDVERKLKKLVINQKVSVGKVRKTKLSYYIDLIGRTCDEDYAKSYARILSSYWVEKVDDSQVKNPHIDFVVTPKLGSPILGYEFAKLIHKPFVLHENEERFSSVKDDDMRRYFNCAEIPLKGARALIVDDSTTGGRMVLETINHLRQYGYVVSDCLVVFEPQSKDAREKLNDQEVNLLSIVKTHKRESVTVSRTMPDKRLRNYKFFEGK